MLFNEKSNASGSLFRVSHDLLIDSCKLWVGGINIDDRNIVVASAEPRFICQYGENSVVTGTRFNGFGLALGTTDPGRNRFGYYAELSPIGPFPGSEMKGYLGHYEQELDDVFLVRGIFATTVDGTSRLDISIDYVSRQHSEHPAATEEHAGEAS